MIKDNQRYLNRLHVVVDAVVTAASYLLAWWLMFGSRFADKEIGVLDMGIYFSALYFCLLYTSDAADEEDSVDLGGRRIIKQNKKKGNDREL